ncbi:hypothetical protein [Streptomyces sp. NPDC057336]|uniref:hypothetical protein n=1 Tax=Streptomyces sp. NPDC057336 TaxID=3346102 RepID=UPI00363AF0A8
MALPASRARAAADRGPVRRRRLRDALLFGTQRQRRSVDERLGKVVAGIVIAAVVCAGCVGWSFVAHRVIGEEREPHRAQQSHPGR